MSDLTSARQSQETHETARSNNTSVIDPSLTAIGNDASPSLATRLKPESLDPQLDPVEKTTPLLQATADVQLLPALSRQDSNVSATTAPDFLKPLDQPASTHDSALPSPTARERLPSISQLTQQLTTHSLPALAEAATQQEARLSQQQQQQHQHSLSYNSNSTHSPAQTNQQPPPAPGFQTFSTGSVRSPTTSNAGDTPYFQGPQAFGNYANFYAHRRPSVAADHQGISLPPSLPSASSSGDSAGPADSNIDGYSTSHTTPIDPAQAMDTTPRPNTGMLPPPPSSGGYKCTFDGCTAQPFQTQYLLTSHKNVHSQDRPHYCPVKECPRGEGGKGFKRKNEMIRHGLVHKSPGYICPFCPEREHKYPRPDNLQRHVKVHHVDKDRDDPLLQEVLNQRTEGQGKTRRRRTTITTILAAPA